LVFSTAVRAVPVRPSVQCNFEQMPMRYLTWFLCIAASALGIGCEKKSRTASNDLPQPFVVSENDGIIHEFYRDITFEQFTPSLPSGSIDSIDFDTTIQDYAIALVTAPRDTDDTELEFTTIFVTDKQDNIVKKWTVASGNKSDKVRGLFLVPKTVASASTTRAVPQQCIDDSQSNQNSTD
jgi:hypothetical protein